MESVCTLQYLLNKKNLMKTKGSDQNCLKLKEIYLTQKWKFGCIEKLIT